MDILQYKNASPQSAYQGCLSGLRYLLITSVIWLPIGLFVGALMGEFHCKYRRFSGEKAIMARVLAGDPSLSNVEIGIFTADGTASLHGSVATKADYDRLRSRMKDLMGESRIGDIMYAVTVKN
jgi:hypothetical protein